MSFVTPKSFAAPLRCMLPERLTLSKESSDLLCSIMDEIHNDFIKVLTKNNGKVLTIKKIQNSVTKLIPTELRRYAFAEGSRRVFEYKSGLISYKSPSLQTRKALQPNMLRKGLETLAALDRPNVILSADCKTAVGLMHSVMHYLADEVIAAIGDQPELTIETLVETLKPIIGNEIFHHAQGHAETNLDWYRSDLLDFRLKAIHTKKIETKPPVLASYVTKFAKQQYSTSIEKGISNHLSNILQCTLNAAMEVVTPLVDPAASRVLTMTEQHVNSALRSILPIKLFRGALTNGALQVLNYNCHILEYHRKETKLEPIPSEEIEEEEEYTPDLRLGIKRIANDYSVSFGRGGLPAMNDTLVDVCKKLVSISCKRIAVPGLLDERDVFCAVRKLFPGQLQCHAIARMSNRRDEMLLIAGQGQKVMHPLGSAYAMNSDEPTASTSANNLCDFSINEDMSIHEIPQEYKDLQNNSTERRLSDEQEYRNQYVPTAFSNQNASQRNGNLAAICDGKPTASSCSSLSLTNYPSLESSGKAATEPQKSSESTTVESMKPYRIPLESERFKRNSHSDSFMKFKSKSIHEIPQEYQDLQNNTTQRRFSNEQEYRNQDLPTAFSNQSASYRNGNMAETCDGKPTASSWSSLSVTNNPSIEFSENTATEPQKSSENTTVESTKPNRIPVESETCKRTSNIILGSISPADSHSSPKMVENVSPSVSAALESNDQILKESEKLVGNLIHQIGNHDKKVILEPSEIFPRASTSAEKHSINNENETLEDDNSALIRNSKEEMSSNLQAEMKNSDNQFNLNHEKVKDKSEE